MTRLPKSPALIGWLLCFFFAPHPMEDTVLKATQGVVDAYKRQQSTVKQLEQRLEDLDRAVAERDYYRSQLASLKDRLISELGVVTAARILHLPSTPADLASSSSSVDFPAVPLHAQDEPTIASGGGVQRRRIPNPTHKPKHLRPYAKPKLEVDVECTDCGKVITAGSSTVCLSNHRRWCKGRQM